MKDVEYSPRSPITSSSSVTSMSSSSSLNNLSFLNVPNNLLISPTTTSHQDNNNSMNFTKHQPLSASPPLPCPFDLYSLSSSYEQSYPTSINTTTSNSIIDNTSDEGNDDVSVITDFDLSDLHSQDNFLFEEVSDAELTSFLLSSNLFNCDMQVLI